jgi:hypothetical protein
MLKRFLPRRSFAIANFGFMCSIRQSHRQPRNTLRDTLAHPPRFGQSLLKPLSERTNTVLTVWYINTIAIPMPNGFGYFVGLTGFKCYESANLCAPFGYLLDILAFAALSQTVPFYPASNVFRSIMLTEGTRGIRPALQNHHSEHTRACRLTGQTIRRLLAIFIHLDPLRIADTSGNSLGLRLIGTSAPGTRHSIPQ